MLQREYQVSEAESATPRCKGVHRHAPAGCRRARRETARFERLDLLPLVKNAGPTRKSSCSPAWARWRWRWKPAASAALHLLTKPFETEKLLADVRVAFESKQKKQENVALRGALEIMSGNTSPVFSSPEMKEVVRTVERVAPSDVTILICGEAARNKEVIADLTHAMSSRSKGRIIKINCAALPAN